MKLIFIFSVCLLFFVAKLSAQGVDSLYVQEQPSSRFFSGGNLGLTFGDITHIEVSPMIGYKIKPTFDIGYTFAYTYYNNRYYDNSIHIVGNSVFIRYHFLRSFFVHQENEFLMYRTNIYNTVGEFDWVKNMNILLGGGLKQAITDASYIQLLVLWNLNETMYTPYSSPIIKGGVVFGL